MKINSCLVMVYFDRVASFYDRILSSERPTKFLDQVGLDQSDKVLEIGAGTGRITKHYYQDVKEVILLDPSTKMLAKAREAIPTAQIAIGVVEDLQFEASSFDKVIGYDSLHHWRDQQKGLEEVYRVLRPGGTATIAEVSPEKLSGKFIVWGEKFLGMGSKFHLPEKLSEMAQAAGFSEVTTIPLHKSTYILKATK